MIMLLPKKNLLNVLLATAAISGLSSLKAEAVPVTISGVPAYDWYHGCGPTAAASVLGYYDMNGYDNLFDASGWDAVRLTTNIHDEISSPEHNAKYDSHPDAPGPAPADTSIADFFHTSENQPYGWSWLSDADDAFTGYANYRGYDDWNAWNEGFGDFTWTDLITEIDNDRPMMFLVDSEGNGQTDHFVSVLGYDDRGADGLWYGAYNTWHEGETIDWYQFRGMSANYSWGVGYGTFIRGGAPDPAPVPEPSALFLFGFGLTALVSFRRKFI